MNVKIIAIINFGLIFGASGMCNQFSRSLTHRAITKQLESENMKKFDESNQDLPIETNEFAGRLIDSRERVTNSFKGLRKSFRRIFSKNFIKNRAQKIDYSKLN